MATVTVPGGVALPPWLNNANSVALTQVSALNADTALVAFVVQAPKTGNIRKVRVGTRTITTGGTVDVRLETIDAATGHPSGTLWGTNTNGSWVIANGDDNVWVTTTLTADAAVVVGDLIGVCVKVATGFSGNLLSAWALNSIASHVPYFRFYNGSAWAGTGAGHPMLMFEYDDGTYAPIRGCFPAGDVTGPIISTATTPDVVGLRFQVPWPCRVRGAWAVVDGDGDFALRLVSSAYHQANATGILASYTADKDVRNSGTVGLYAVDFAAPVSLSANTNYRLVVEPTSATTLTGPYDITVPSLAGLDAWMGATWHLTSAKDPTGDGDWTNYNSGTFRVPPLMGLIIDGFDNATSAGGISRARVQLGM